MKRTFLTLALVVAVAYAQENFIDQNYIGEWLRREKVHQTNLFENSPLTKRIFKNKQLPEEKA